MDYPELNLLIGLALALTLGVSLSTLALIYRMEFPAILKIELGILAGLGVLAAGYVYTRLIPTLPQNYQAVLILGILAIAGLSLLTVRWLSQMESSGTWRAVLIVVMIASLALNAWLAIVLYRSLVPPSAAHSPLDPIALAPYALFFL